MFRKEEGKGRVGRRMEHVPRNMPDHLCFAKISIIERGKCVWKRGMEAVSG